MTQSWKKVIMVLSCACALVSIAGCGAVAEDTKAVEDTKTVEDTETVEDTKTVENIIQTKERKGDLTVTFWALDTLHCTDDYLPTLNGVELFIFEGSDAWDDVPYAYVVTQVEGAVVDNMEPGFYSVWWKTTVPGKEYDHDNITVDETSGDIYVYARDCVYED